MRKTATRARAKKIVMAVSKKDTRQDALATKEIVAAKKESAKTNPEGVRE
jgi:hypothetical protein